MNGEAIKPVGQILQAADFAARMHTNQRRKDADASPYINHPIRVAETLWRTGGVHDPAVLVAAILHDTIEDTEATYENLLEEFGTEIAGIVQEVSDDKSLDKQVRKQLQIEHAPFISDKAKLVKLADKICNVEDICSHPPRDWPLTRRRDYLDWAAAVVNGLRGVNSSLEAEFDRLLTEGRRQLLNG